MRPADHPLRSELNHEIHARPSESLSAPVRISYLALASSIDSRDEEWRHVLALAKTQGVDIPAHPTSHFSADFGDFGIRWERHAEFTRYTFSTPCTGDVFASTALEQVPAAWSTQFQVGCWWQVTAASSIKQSIGMESMRSPPAGSRGTSSLALRWRTRRVLHSRIFACAPMASAASSFLITP